MSWRLLPGHCILCNEPSGIAMDLCPYCRAALPWLIDACPRCALPNTEPARATCAACDARPPPFQRAISAFRYSDPVARMIHRVKFGGSRVDARVLGCLTGACIAQLDPGPRPIGVIAPVPLSDRRLRQRGHNQAALIAHWIGRTVSLPVDYGLCRRTRHTGAQTSLGRGARLTNLRNAFAAGGRARALDIAIVDDVMTTGATATALTAALLAAGANSVHVWTVARTMPPQPQPSAPLKPLSTRDAG